MALSGIEQVGFHRARKRRRSLAGFPNIFRTVEIKGATDLPVASIDVTSLFPVRTTLITFKTRIRILENTGVHRGLIFELGDAAIGTALWVGDQTIGFHAGEDLLVNGADAVHDRGSELPVGLIYNLVAAVKPGTGQVRLWNNGQEIARGTASGGGFGAAAAWAAGSAGSFASTAQGGVVADVPAASQGAPAGFEVIEPLSVYMGSVPWRFI